jgi:hypothetical protein
LFGIHDVLLLNHQAHLLVNLPHQQHVVRRTDTVNEDF